MVHTSGQRAIYALGIGATAGFTGSLVGMGGAFLTIPMMTRFLRLTQHQAHGTSALSITMAGLVGAYGYYTGGFIDLPTAATMTMTSMIFARVGARASARVSQDTLKTAVGVLWLVVAPLPLLRDEKEVQAELVRRNTRKAIEAKEQKNIQEIFVRDLLNDPQKTGKLLGIGTVSGVLAGFFGVGGGAVTVPALAGATALDHRTILGTSLAAMVLPAAVSAGTHALQGTALAGVGLPLAAGTALGAWAGSRAAPGLPEDRLRWLFSGLLFGLGAGALGPRLAARLAAAAAGGRGGGKP